MHTAENVWTKRAETGPFPAAGRFRSGARLQGSPFNLDVGKHGDTGTSELELLRALREDQADVGALGDSTWARQVAQGRVDPRLLRSIWTSPG